MTKIIIDNKEYEVKDGKNLLEVALSLGLDLPYFCWHPALGSVGACRQCAVKQFKDENDKQGKIAMACMTPAGEGTRISIKDPEAVEFRANVIEWLMVNHPHDCPICDEGGECHLQDMTVMTGHNYRRFRHRKRTFRNQYLGPFINHEMNRCITCYRCVRFYRDYADGDDLNSFAAHNHVYFGRHEDGVLENEFSGNLVEVCPTGVFTDKTLKQHYARKWDLQTAPSVCQQCGLGCNTIPGERYGSLRRILNRYNGEVNGYFLCDRGRFGYEFVNSEQRIRHAMVEEGSNGQIQITKDAALNLFKTLIKDPARAIGIGSPRASLEGNYALQRFVGADKFFNGMSGTESELVQHILKILTKGSVPSASLKQVKESDAVLVLGEDLTNTAPMLALAIRQAVRRQPTKTAIDMNIPEWHDAAVREVVQQQKGPLFVATPAPTKLDDVARQTYRAAPDDIARLGFAVAHELKGEAPAVPNISKEIKNLVEDIADALRTAERPVVIAGTSLHSKAIVQASANVAWALKDKNEQAKICYTVPECNSLGIGSFAERSLDDALQLAESGNVKAAIILENDLYRRAPQEKIDRFFDAIEHIIAVDHLQNPTTQRAELVLPASTFAEGAGTLVNNEGRAQRFFRVYVPEGGVQESWRWIRDAHTENGKWENLDKLTEEIISNLSVFKKIKETAPDARYRISGQKIARQEHRYSGRTAMRANKTVYEPAPPDDPDSPLAHSMEGYRGSEVPAATVPYFWAPAWNSVQATNKYQSEVGGPLRGGDPGIRLIEPGGNKKFFTEIPPEFKSREGDWLVVPLYHIFGSEELSVVSTALAKRIPEPYLVLNPEDVRRLNIESGDEAEIEINGQTEMLPLILEEAVPRGVVGLPCGLPEMKHVEFPTWAGITKGGQK
ncbi:NADH-quinone oxidoreductase subunit NuoG [candidate division KSB1 bacterium]|nr:NADH-quinone oxidoreductase subunit NuoG [candidate division KSB1 bacterium]NIR70758.1 NADH-quinone oxidoreductase subunit NuoG [candidate division KSB1 bacterium]NIS23211.1 NADH-quinone oxidoreductase subunit NuoG [candidate division KSB1 bacterium]NIT70071.1 NADH-quinone oxidoreductase subunit NuoG [candidate division KSB1 bacterium]NIU23708.1 NADH-quinone oxidoreductase subunit NuoG [candidate division KSB1 bacterium]